MSTLTTTTALTSGVEIPTLGFGTWQVPDGPATYDAVAEALRVGYRHIDTARAYGNEASVARGLARTGRLITNAAALLVVVVGAFITSDILFMKTLGVGMALAVGLDATVIRALLVPATMRLMGGWNWWAPAPLKKLWLKSGLGEHSH